MAELPTRVFLADVRDNDQYLRATWHPEEAVVVVSHWVGEVCVASTPIGVADLSKLVGVLVAALQDSATRSVEAATEPASPPVTGTGGTATVVERIRRCFRRCIRRRSRPKLAEIIALRHGPEGIAQKQAHGR